MRLLADTALARALDGVEERVLWKGEAIGTKRRYNDRLLMFLLQNRRVDAPLVAPEPGKPFDRTALHSVAGLAGALDRIAPPDPGREAGPRLRSLP